MQPAIIQALVTTVLNLAMAVAMFAIARAPGWRGASIFGWIALSASAYCAGNYVFAFPGLADTTYLAAGRWNYLWANLHAVAWLPYVFGGPAASWRAMPRPARWVGAAGLAAAAVFAVTGAHLSPAIRAIDVAWAGARYHYPTATPAGDTYGWCMLAILGISFVTLAARLARGDHSLRALVTGFVVFFACSTIELLVGNGDLEWMSPADLGFLAVVVPTSLTMLRRFVQDARRLHELSGRLEGEVRERTAERDRAHDALLESEKHAALGRLAAGVGHEINNPLTYLTLSLDRIEDHLIETGAPKEVLGAVADARDGTWRIQKVVEGLRTYSRRQDERRALDLGEAARSALKVARPHLRHVARLETDLQPVPPVLGDEPRLVQAIVNLLTNAAQAVSVPGIAGHIALRTRRGSGGAVMLEVEDDGPGIAARDRERLFEPYFTTRAGQGGLGLGLFVTRGIVDAHGGRLEVDSGDGRGTRVRITLPALRGMPDPEPGSRDVPRRAPVAAAAPPSPAHRRVLVVDDEPRVLELLTTMLGREWDVEGAADGAEALRRLAERRPDAIVCDLMMPGLSGMELADAVARTDPDLRARMLFLTGGAITPAAEEFLARADVVALEKPVTLPDLVAAVRERLAAAPV